MYIIPHDEETGVRPTRADIAYLDRVRGEWVTDLRARRDQAQTGGEAA
ncbi:hypothetical protein ACFY05_42145 [Microtetraspora fusca]|uniref:Uncharacterized protein n=1 Tax=Microtetraspora fusca TaxID=1997 RepID=A0ABW6VMG0_MICFU